MKKKCIYIFFNTLVYFFFLSSLVHFSFFDRTSLYSFPTERAERKKQWNLSKIHHETRKSRRKRRFYKYIYINFFIFIFLYRYIISIHSCFFYFFIHFIYFIIFCFDSKVAFVFRFSWLLYFSIMHFFFLYKSSLR